MHGWHATSTWWPCSVAKFSWGKCSQTPLDLRGYTRISHSAPLTWSIFCRHCRVPIFEWILLFRKLIWWVATYIHRVATCYSNGWVLILLSFTVLQERPWDSALGTTPGLSTFIMSHLCAKSSRSFTSIFIYCKWSKTRWWEQGYPMSTSTSMYLHVCWPLPLGWCVEPWLR